MRTWTVEGSGGVSLHVEEAGDPSGPPILFLHGFSQCGLCWDRQFESPALRRFRLVRMDLRGHGRSGKPEDAYGEAGDWAGNVAAVIDALGLDRPVVVAWSYAGTVILDYVAVHGTQAIAGIDLVAAVSKVGRPLKPFLGEDFTELVQGFYLAGGSGARTAMRAFLELCYEKRPDDETFERALDYNMLVPARVRRGMFARRVDHDALMARLDLPVLLSYGSRDRVVLPAMGEHHARLIPGADLSVYEGIGHSLFQEDAARFDRELADFADRLGG